MKIVFHSLAKRVVQTDRGELKKVPNYILGLTVFISFNVLFQGIADLILKFGGYTPLIPPMPWRTDFLFLTAISVLMGYRTYTGMKRLKFDVTRNSIELGVLVESALIIGDIEFIIKNFDSMPYLLVLRLPFILLTSINLVLLVFIYQKLHLRTWWRINNK